jgi:hypothetical protein
MKVRKTIFVSLAVLVVAATAEAVIKAPLPLKQILKESQYIVLAKVDQLYPDKPAMSLKIEEDLKGKAPFRTLPIFLKGGKEAEKLNHTPQLLKRLAPELPVVLFVHYDAKTERYISFAYTNGTWFQLVGQKTGADSLILSLTSGEPYLRRTFKGTTEEMKQTVADALKGKKKAPEYNAKEEPGFGPEVTAQEK